MQMATQAPVEIHTLIDGELVPGAAKSTLEVSNPSTGTVLAELRESSPQQVDEAVAAARAAQRAWSRQTPAFRSDALRRIADRLEENLEQFAWLETLDAGKPYTAALTVEAPVILDSLRYFATAGRSANGPAAGEYVEGKTSMVRREPMGVVAAITPWNFPLFQAVLKIAPALATGNTVVVKPAEAAPLSTTRFVELANEVLPPGVLNVIHGAGPSVGERLVSHPDVSLVSFTGSTRAGRRIAELAGSAAKRLVLELGGNAPVVIHEDADIEKAVPTLATAILFNAGQECMSGNRILVAASAHDELTSRLAAELSKWRLGDASDPETQLGPMISAAQLARVRELVDGRPAHAEIVIGGDSPARPGFFFNATLIAGVRQPDELVQYEVFGPVATVQRFESDDEALELANGTPYGLAASVWTRDIGRGLRWARELDFGNVWINSHFVLGPEIPQGGFAASGYGREGGVAGIEEFTRLKHVAVNLD